MSQPRHIAPAAGAINTGQPFSRPTTLVDSGVGASSVVSRKRPRTDVGDGGCLAKLSGSGGHACHFYRRDPHKHVNCLGYSEFGGPKEVKQHLDRVHKWPDFCCPTCGMISGSQTLNDEHTKARLCEPREFSYPGLVSPKQRETIDNIISRRNRKSGEEKWYEIWDVLFPDQERPETTRRLSMEHETARNVQRFAQTAAYRSIQEKHLPEAKDQARMFLDAVMKSFAEAAEEARVNVAPDNPPPEADQSTSQYHDLAPDNPTTEADQSTNQHDGGNMWPGLPPQYASSSLQHGGAPPILLEPDSYRHPFGEGYDALGHPTQDTGTPIFSFGVYPANAGDAPETGNLDFRLSEYPQANAEYVGHTQEAESGFDFGDYIVQADAGDAAQ